MAKQPVCRQDCVEERAIEEVPSGLWVGELLALRWGSVDLNARLLRVCETVYDGHFGQPKTKRSARTIPIGTETAEILAALRPAVVDPKTLELLTLDCNPFEVEQEFVSAKPSFGHPRFTDKPILLIDPEPDQLHYPVAAPRSERYVWNLIDRGGTGHDSG